MNALHVPYYSEAAGSDGLVVFIHGFMGSPRQFDRLAETAHQHSRSAAALLLPGHGGSVKDFSAGTMERWQEHVNDEIERLSRYNKSIWLVGHSMGCLLAINAAVRYSEYVRGLLLIACPLKLKWLTLRNLRIRVLPVTGRKTNPMKKEYLSGCSVKRTPDFLWRFTKPLSELKKLMAVARDNLPNISAPVTAVFMPADEVVSIDSLEILKSGLSDATLKQIILYDSLHAYFPEHEFASIEHELTEFLNEGNYSEAL